MTFGEQNSFAEASAQLNLATESGINFFDTAEMYPVPQRAETHGKSEEYLGDWLKSSTVARESVIIATKVAGPSGQMEWIRGGPHSVDAQNIREAIDGSLRRLKTDYIDLYQIHWPDRYVPMFGDVDFDPSMDYGSVVPLEEQLEALARAVEEGKIRYVGVSNETPWGVMQLCQLAKAKQHLPKIVSVQNAFSLLCRTFDSTLAECCHREAVSLLGYSPLAMGLLTGKYLDANGGGSEARLNRFRGRYAEAECRYPVGSERVRQAVSAYVEIAKRHGVDPTVMAVAFAVRHPLMASVVAGATNVQQLNVILSALEYEMDGCVAAEVNEVHKILPNPTP